MNLFVKIHDRKTDIDTELSMAQLASYRPATVTDLDGSTHICIIYKTNFGLVYEEEFDNTSDRDDKIEVLEEYSSSGGGGANLQIKDVTITENGNSVINPDEGYDGLEKVNVTTNVSGSSDIDWSQIGYDSEPLSLNDEFIIAKDIYDNWDPTTTYATNMFKGAKIGFFPNVDTSNLVYVQNMFSSSSVREIVNLDLPRASNCDSICYECRQLQYVNNFMPYKNKKIKSAFSYCTSLKRINKFRITNNSDNEDIITNTDNLVINELLMNGPYGGTIFSRCQSIDIKKITNEDNHTYRNNVFCANCSFTDDTMDEILKYFKTLTQQGNNYKTLKSLGFKPTNCDQAVASNYWQDLVDDGWTTGY